MTTAERLSILAEIGPGLLHRLFTIKKDLETNEKNELLRPTNQNKSLFARITKSDTLDFPEDIDKKEASAMEQWFKPKMSNILKHTTPIFSAFKEYDDWCDVAIHTLEELFDSFNWDQNLPIFADVMNTVVYYAKLVLIVDKIPDKKNVVALYNLAYSKTNGRSEPAVGKLGKRFKTYEKPTKELRAVFFKLAPQIGRTLINSLASFDKGTVEALNIKRPLELLSEPDKIPFPAIEDTYFEITYHNEIRDWVVFGYLCCPEGLGFVFSDKKQSITRQNSNLKGIFLLQAVLNKTFLVTIYGDETLYVHELFDEVFSKFKATSINLKNEKKVLKASEEVALNCSRVHFKKRTYLRLQLQTLFTMLRDFPGLAGPKFQLVMAALHLAKMEIYWYFTHHDKQPKKNAKKYREIPQTDLSELIHLILEITSICRKKKQVIADYYLDLLKKVYAPKLKPLIEKYAGKYDEKTKSLFLSFLDASDAKSFKAFRMNLKRFEIITGSQEFEADRQEDDFQRLLSTLNIYFHISKNVDSIEEQLYEFATLKDLYYFDKVVYTFFKDGLISDDNRPLYSLSFLRLLDSYQYSAHESVPEMRANIGYFSVTEGKNMLNAMLDAIEKQIDNLRGSGGYQFLADQIGGDKVGMKIKLKIQKKEVPQPAGYESFLDDDYVYQLINIENNLKNLLYSLNTFDEIQVYDTIFYPSEFLREKLETIILRWVSDISKSPPPITQENKKSRDKDPLQMAFLQPKMLQEKLAVFMIVLKVVEQCKLILYAFLENFVHLNDVESPYIHQIMDTSENSTTRFAQWYSDLINDMTKYKILYHPLRKSFLSTSATPFSYKVEEYCDFEELIALSQMIGPYGIRVMDYYIVQKITAYCTSLKDLLPSFNDLIKENFDKLFNEPQLNLKLFDTLKGKFKAIDKVFDLLISIGGLLEFRRNLREALEISIQKSIPLIYNVVENTYKQYPQNYMKDIKFVDTDGLALDVGIFKDKIDHVMKDTMLMLSDKVTNFQYFPQIFACLLFSPTWTSSSNEYNVHLEGWNNNAHLAINAFHSLMIALYCKDHPKAIYYEYSKFTDLATYLMFLMKNQNDKVIDNCYIFVDKTIATTDFIDSAKWEESFPYALVRRVYSRVYAKKKK